MNNLLSFTSYNSDSNESLNESFLQAIKDKIKAKWDRFSFKEKMDILYKLNTSKKITSNLFAAFGALVLGTYLALDNTPETRTMVDGYVVVGALNIILGYLSKISNKIKKNDIVDKVRDLRADFLNKNIDFQWIYLVTGKKNNIDKAINRLIEDNVLNDTEIIHTDEITLIDLSGKFKDEKKISAYPGKDVDPFREETWGEEDAPPIRRDIFGNDFHKQYKAKFLGRIEKMYDVNLRPIEMEDHEDDNKFPDNFLMKKYSRKTYNERLPVYTHNRQNNLDNEPY